MSNEMNVQRTIDRPYGFDHPNEVLRQEAIAYIESVALRLDRRDDLLCYAKVLNKATVMLCDLDWRDIDQSLLTKALDFIEAVEGFLDEYDDLICYSALLLEAKVLLCKLK
jgi:hypothetical protein